MGVLSLARGCRVEINSQKYEFRPRLSTGCVKLDVALELIGDDYIKISHLLRPGLTENEILALLEDQLMQICRDQIQKIERKHFNLEFDKTVEGSQNEQSVHDILVAAFNHVFGTRYGMKVAVIHISQAQTEEGERFVNIRGQATPFTLNISSQADSGMRDRVVINGVFEVTDIAVDGWDRFQGKDFGYGRQSMYWTSDRLAELKKDVHSIGVSDSKSAEFERERKARAIKNELSEMGKRISAVLTDALSKIASLDLRSREWGQITSLRKESEKIAEKLVLDEFGLIIKFREFGRADTKGELLQEELRGLKYDQILGRAKKDFKHGDELVDLNHENKKALLQDLGDYRREQLNRDPDEGHSEESIKKNIDDIINNNDGMPFTQGTQ